MGGGGILDKKKSMFFVVTPCNFSFPLGSLWTQDLYCHPGTFAYNCPGLLEDDLGIQHPGKCRVDFFVLLLLLYSLVLRDVGDRVAG